MSASRPVRLGAGIKISRSHEHRKVKWHTSRETSVDMMRLYRRYLPGWSRDEWMGMVSSRVNDSLHVTDSMAPRSSCLQMRAPAEAPGAMTLEGLT